MTRAVLPSMRARRSGHVINISSLGGCRSGPGFGVYCSTKFAVEGLTEALHGELALLGIHATAVEPGYFRTEFLEGSLNQPGDPLRLAQAMLRLPMGTEALQVIRDKHAFVKRETKAWEALAASTDFARAG